MWLVEDFDFGPHVLSFWESFFGMKYDLKKLENG